METVNIYSESRQCWNQCYRWDGPDPELGDVRRCKHGRAWLYANCLNWPLPEKDRWKRLHPILNPFKEPAAVRALGGDPDPGGRRWTIGATSFVVSLLTAALAAYVTRRWI